jgi:enamine deaminase RidA (YjgF/YER057c/UK114 family)
MSNELRQNYPSGVAYEAIFGYSRAVRAGNDIHISGTCASPNHADGDTDEQAGVALGLIERALIDAGARMHNVVRTIIYLLDIRDADAVARVYLSWFGTIRPATTVVQVSSLRRPWQKVAIEVYAKL